MQQKDRKADIKLVLFESHSSFLNNGIKNKLFVVRIRVKKQQEKGRNDANSRFYKFGLLLFKLLLRENSDEI